MGIFMGELLVSGRVLMVWKNFREPKKVFCWAYFLGSHGRNLLHPRTLAVTRKPPWRHGGLFLVPIFSLGEFGWTKTAKRFTAVEKALIFGLGILQRRISTRNMSRLITCRLQALHWQIWVDDLFRWTEIILIPLGLVRISCYWM